MTMTNLILILIYISFYLFIISMIILFIILEHIKKLSVYFKADKTILANVDNDYLSYRKGDNFFSHLKKNKE